MIRGIVRLLSKGLPLPVLLLAALAGWVLTATPEEGFPILEYHMVKENPSTEERPYVVPPADFAEQLDYLTAEGYTTITPQDYARARKGKQTLPEKPVILSFDDGYEDNYRVVLPMLEERGMKAVFYMVTNDIGLPGYLTWDALRDMQERGIEIGSHTANHLPLTGMPPSEAEKEVKLSKLLLEWNGIRTVFGFSYPNGSYADYISAILKRNEYLAAVTGDPGLNTMDTDPYLLQRINIPRPRLGLTEFRLRLFKADLCDRLGLWRHRIK